MSGDFVGVNVGCGRTVTDGYFNYDNSFSLRLARMPSWLIAIARRLRFVSDYQIEYVTFCKDKNVIWCDATRHIPHQDNSVDVIYASHMMEHLSRENARNFLREALRVLKPNGVIRLALPDIQIAVQTYLKEKDADEFIRGIYVEAPPVKTLKDKLSLMLVGYRHHQWMYDGASLVKLLSEIGFSNAAVQPAGETMIENHGALNLSERAEQSVYAEARA